MTLAVPIVQLATFLLAQDFLPFIPVLGHLALAGSSPGWSLFHDASVKPYTVLYSSLYDHRAHQKGMDTHPPWRSLCLTSHLSLRGRTHSLPVPGGEIAVKTKGSVTPTVFFILPSNVNCLDNPEVVILKFLKFAVILNLYPGFNLEWSD